MVFGKTVTVEWVKRDRYGRVLGRVLLDGQDINLAQLKAGLAWYYRAYESDIEPARRKPYADAEAEAKAAKRGLWTDPNPQPPWDFRRTGAATVTRDSGPATTQSVTGGKIIGNRNSMIFHAPNCPDYARVSERNRVYFSTEAEAQRAGYRKARNCP